MLKSMLANAPSLYRLANRLRGTRIHEPDHSLATMQLGGDASADRYGEWTVPTELLNAGSIVYSFGVGEDISFDLALIKRFGCDVFAYDPSPVAEAFVARTQPPPQFHFAPIGIADIDGSVGFAPQGRGLRLPAREAGSVDLPVRRLATLAAANGHTEIDLVKLDVEGFEHGVLPDIAGSIRPRCVLVEFHHPWHGTHADTRRSVSAMKQAGYQLFSVSDYGSDYGFIRD